MMLHTESVRLSKTRSSHLISHPPYQESKANNHIYIWHSCCLAHLPCLNTFMSCLMINLLLSDAFPFWKVSQFPLKPQWKLIVENHVSLQHISSFPSARCVSDIHSWKMTENLWPYPRLEKEEQLFKVGSTLESQKSAKAFPSILWMWSDLGDWSEIRDFSHLFI